jgi:hypothetical protein
MPAMLYVVDGDDGNVNVREISFGKVSVVQIAFAVASQWSWETPKPSKATGILQRIFSIGNL